MTAQTEMFKFGYSWRVESALHAAPRVALSLFATFGGWRGASNWLDYHRTHSLSDFYLHLYVVCIASDVVMELTTTAEIARIAKENGVYRRVEK